MRGWRSERSARSIGRAKNEPIRQGIPPGGNRQLPDAPAE